MGVDLIKDAGDEFQFNNSGWRYLIAFSEMHGFAWPSDAGVDATNSLSVDEAAALADAH